MALLALDAGAQSVPFPHLSVELSDPVYLVIDAAELRGAVQRLSSVKPYSRIQVLRLLETMLGKPGRFSGDELSMIRAEYDRFSSGGNDRALWTSKDGKASAGVRVEATGRLDLDEMEAPFTDAWHLHSLERFYLASDVAPWLSGWGVIGITVDKLERATYLPYRFTKEWDSIHWDITQAEYSEGTKDHPTLADDISQDIAGATASGSFAARFSRIRHDWGTGSGSLALSSSARPFFALETGFRPSEYFAVSSMIGALSDRTKGGNDKSTAKDSEGNYSAISYQKMLSIHRMELFPFSWLSLAGTSTAVGAKRFELGYIAPFVNDVKYQSAVSDVDNVALMVDGQVILPGFGKLYGSFYADEMALSELDTMFTKARQMFALQGGARLVVPGLPFATFSAQYTKIEPFVYAHYPTWYADYRLRVDTAYTHDAENLGYRLPPNSDEFLVSISTLPASGWKASLEYSFVRHGTNPGNRGDLVVFGDVTRDLPYTTAGLSMDKDFLHDGIYDYNHIARIEASWRPQEPPEILGHPVPLELGLGYNLAYTWYEDGTGAGRTVGNSAYDPFWTNALEVSCKIFL